MYITLLFLGIFLLPFTQVDYHHKTGLKLLLVLLTLSFPTTVGNLVHMSTRSPFDNLYLIPKSFELKLQYLFRLDSLSVCIM